MNVTGNVFLFVLCWQRYYQGGARLNLSLLMILGYAVLVTWLARIYNAYHINLLRVSEVLLSLTLASVLSGILVYFAIVSVRWRWVDPLPLIGLSCIQFLWNLLWSVCARQICKNLTASKSAVVIYRSGYDLRKIQEFARLSGNYTLAKYIEDPDEIHALLQQLEGFPVVFVSGISATLRNGVAKYCVEKDLEMYTFPHVGDVIMAGARYMQMYSIPIMRVTRAKPIPEYLLLKRLFDILLSGMALVLLSPVMLLTALAIKLQDGGPVIYRQTRLTKDRRAFEILKFRSMVISAEQDGQARLSSEHDKRITPVGKIIRTFRIDELPQLLNILKGDMSIVGPRPERPEIAAQYEAEIPAFALRLQVKAGLTGLAQVYGRYNSTPDEKLQMDLMYINHLSLLEDIRLMFATVKVLFQKESTNGIADNAMNALDAFEEPMEEKQR